MTTMTDLKLRPSLRQRMLAGETLLGSWINSGSPIIAELMAARAAILAACKRHGVAPGIHVVPPVPGDVRGRRTKGYRFIAYSLDITMLTTACTEGLAALRPKAKRL